MSNFKQYTIALLILLFCAGSVIVGITSALTSEVSDSYSLWNNGKEYQEYQGAPYSTVYYSAPAQGTSVAVPMRSVNSGILRHPQASYQAGAHSVNNVPSGYASQGLTTTAHPMVSSYGTSAGGRNGYSVVGSSNYARGGNVGYSVGAGQSTTFTSTQTYAGTTNHPLQVVGGQQTSVYYAKVEASAAFEGTGGQSARGGRRRIIVYDGVEYGEYDGEENSDKTKIWDEETQSWVDAPAIGTERTINGVLSVWTINGWIPKKDLKDPDSPIGDTPWLFFGLLVAGYIGVVTCKRNKRRLLPFILLAVMALPAWAKPGDTCNDPIRLGKDYKVTITQTGTVWYVANTFDLPLSVEFITETPTPPDVKMDFTCEKGVYEDSILCSLFCPKGGSGGITIEMPHKPQLKYKSSDDGRHCYYISMGKTYRDMLFQAGLEHDVDVYIEVTYYSIGDMSVSPENGNFSSCMDGGKIMHIGDTIHVHAGDKSRYVVLPYIRWQDDSIRYVWQGTDKLTLITATDCDFDPSRTDIAAEDYVVEFYPERNPSDTIKITSEWMKYCLSDDRFSNAGGVYFAKWYSEGDGILTVERVPVTPPDGGAVLMQYDKATPITPSDTTNVLYALPRVVCSFTQFVSHTDHVIRMWVGTTPALSAANAIGAYTFAATDEGQVLNMDSLTLDALWKQTKGNYLYLKIWCTARTTITPYRWAPSDCAYSTKQMLFTGPKRIARTSTGTVYKMLYSEWRGGNILIESDKAQECRVFVADTCTDMARHTVIPYPTLTKSKPVTFTADVIASWADRVDPDGYLYWRFYHTMSQTPTITITRFAPEPTDPEPDKYPSAKVSVQCIGTPDENGAQQVEIHANAELHLRLVDANGKRINEWDAWKNAKPMTLNLKSGTYQLITDNENIQIVIP